MVCFIVTRGHGYTLSPLAKMAERPVIRVMTYDSLMRSRWLRRASYVFTDIDRLSHGDLEHASVLYLEMKRGGLVVWNNPATVKIRYPLLRALHTAGLNDFNVYRIDDLNSAVRYPVFLRNTYGHTGPLTDLLHKPEDLNRSIDAAIASGVPEQNLIVIEYAAEPVREGVFRKHAAYRLGGEIIPHVSAHDTAWMIKAGQIGCADESFYVEEQEHVKTNPYSATLQRAFEIANVEYGRVDYGIAKGRVQVYEINSNPTITPPKPHPSPARGVTRALAWENFLKGLNTLDSPKGLPVRIDDGNLQRSRPWKNILMRTRMVR